MGSSDQDESTVKLGGSRPARLWYFDVSKPGRLDDGSGFSPVFACASDRDRTDIYRLGLLLSQGPNAAWCAFSRHP